ncbi:hypothetical protein RA27_02090 [Ruegeria sp. ANG-R]|uniref:hypothetical protein n=1 Tax=Ruegeria sp. ANG-R TaxID=1577903 RepID=UPI0005800DFC|nr:hypothetical protein [Ruegeria sp. ANG-R]KIC42208.1 hypothetical protein RA27_02090 [Ruegeria sp. ANG-R]
MPKVKTVIIDVESAGKWHSTPVEILVNSDGEFYCNVPECALVFFQTGGTYNGATCEVRRRGAKRQLFAPSFNTLHQALSKGITSAFSPDVREEHVIRYNIESHVAFWEKSDGTIVPNGYFADSVPGSSDRDGQWADQGTSRNSMFGGHHAINPAKGGYSLTIGAKALTKRTETYGEAEKVTYSEYYAGGSHLGGENPAQRLNGWVSFELPKNCREMPYTDEAAEFFYKLLIGMAQLSRMIQNATFEEADLMRAISNNSLPMLASS